MSSRLLALLTSAVVFATSLSAQSPNVIVGDLPDISNYGSANNIAAFAWGTTSCNTGTANLTWISNTNQHPVIPQNAYRIHNGRFEQIGMSWLKHGFYALSQTLCGSCPNPTDGTSLGIGCSDPYTSGLNGDQGNGPRSEINATTGYFPFPYVLNPPVTSVIDRRLQIKHADLSNTTYAGAIYLAEAQYIQPEDAVANNDNDNASYRRVYFTANGTSYNAAFQSGAGNTTVRMKAAIEGWPLYDPTVTLTNFDNPGDGRFIIARRVQALGNGLTKYFYAVHNLNSDRSAKAFTVNFGGTTTISNLYFHDVDYHSGEVYSGTDWAATVTPTSVTWTTDDCTVNPNANALRWGTCYSFEFVANNTPVSTTITPFKPAIVGGVCPPQPPAVSIGGYQVASVPYVSYTAAGTVGPTGDDTSVTANLGFTFSLYGNAMTQIKVGSNGYLCPTTQDGNVYTNSSLPSAGVPNGVIAGYWTDLDPSAAGSGQVRYQTVGTAPNRRFVVTYTNVYRYGTTQAENFQIFLEETTNAVYFTCVTTSSGGSAGTRGIENLTGTSGTLVSINAANSMQNGTTIKLSQMPSNFVPPSANLSWTGAGTAGSTLQVRVVSRPSLPLLLLVDSTPGPFPLPGNLGTLNLGLSAGMWPVVDGIGLFGFADPNGKTDCVCGTYDILAVVPPGLSGVTIYSQGIVLDATAPNGSFHLTTPVTYNFP